MKVPTGQESARPFLPTRDFEVCCAFYESLGFKKLLEGDVAIFEIGSTSFILQRRFEKTWAENCMMQLMVDDLDAWWKQIERLELAVSFGVPQPKALQCSRGACGLAIWSILPGSCGTSPNGALVFHGISSSPALGNKNRDHESDDPMSIGAYRRTRSGAPIG